MKVKYRTDSRIDVAEIKWGKSTILVDLLMFLRHAVVDISESNVGEVDIEPALYVKFKNTPYQPKKVELNGQRVRKAKEKRSID